jgi:hypothetical protein
MLIDDDTIAGIKSDIQKQSEFNTINIRDIVLHFQIMKSARVSRLMLDAPGLYFSELGLYIISKSGSSRGHATLYKSILPLIPEGAKVTYGFVLYPESYVRTCLDKMLRKSTCTISKDMRLSMENVFNKKYHGGTLVGSPIESELVALLQKGLERRK